LSSIRQNIKENGAKYSAIPTRYGWNLGAVKEASYQSFASTNPDKNFIAVDIKDEVLALAMKKIENEYALIGAETKTSGLCP